MADKKVISLDRRNVLKACGSAVVAGAAIAGFPAIIRAQSRTPTLRVVGTHVTLQEKIRRRAEKDLGINIEFYPGGSAEVMLRASTAPDSFDLYEQWSNSLNTLWQANTIQPIQISRLTYWDEVNDLTKKGKLSPDARIGLGDAPYKLLYVQPDGTLGATQAKSISFLPYVHNVDSFGYNSAVIPRGTPYETESWGWLLDDRYRGKVALVNEPSIGLFDAALAVKAKGLMDFADMGNMSRTEVDQLFAILLDYKKRGHFRGVWSSVPNSVELMQSGQVVIQSMFSPGVSVLNGMGIPCIYAAPKEGYRAWHGVMCLSRNCKNEQQEAAYAFMNWWLSGWPGAFIARQGYYISNPQRSRSLMSVAEWDYWYEGQPAAEALRGTDGKISVQPGEVRTGGSYIKRFENIAIWNTVMDSYEYTLLKWNEFVLS
ncbi:MAG: signal peptide prediction [Zetaproteobacteria bacterium CG_4_9_14_3_um_filter_49_83]|nr:MAG: signal peptide prediction [Zetaproteobacteria bacterium CG1_02_49_23]PIQ31654.1 MAG: signal peptide prediction [Zetaproteobacteria bacterium CG17_big_fil_post_rev_8_21_14_2_50_50_13]PIV31159.1 MAG: signal peptide prediction [Zetaproteobacteria bacterium CG02_land_8_20_14_3_00_50_9]PIY55520.1 MAG: signal peptide prediction [Zetaproteobacteria bacterium CG_4_10_14_0_8_um_filter_49_80]PJA34876.1 MAG: signal peptide prediction [Zetaproteobacteria bacterium CG_4_9_14_3_um_filter_49_83]